MQTRKITLFILLLSGFILGSIQQTKASHAVGANLTYAYVSPNHYTVTVKFYRDCCPTCIQAPTSVTVNYTSSSCGSNGNITLNAVAGTGQEIMTGLFPPCGVSTCNGGTGYKVQEWEYRATLTLPTACADWVLSCTINARNVSITTINNSGGNVSLYVESTLDNLNYPVNSSPQFSHYPVSTFCLNHPFAYNQGATDPDGDSLVFSLVDALSGAGIIVPYYNPPYNGLNPFSSSTGVNIDPNTGIITFTPNLIQIAVMAVLVQEYRNGVLIGSVRRDMQMNIEAICNFPPTLQPSTLNNVTANCGDSILFIHLLVPIRCNSVAFDGSDFRMVSPSGLPIPVTREIPINCVNGMSDSIEIHLYPPNLSENGTYVIYSKIGTDGNTLLNDCGNSMAEYDTVRFSFQNCYQGIVDLRNVSVDNPNTTMQVLWNVPPALPVPQFLAYDIYRSDYPGGPYFGIGSVVLPNDTFFVDTSVSVSLQPYDYAVRVRLNYGFVSPLSDSIQSIYLTGNMNADSQTVSFNWTPYWGWPSPQYEFLQSTDLGTSYIPVAGSSTSNTSYVYSRPSDAGTYLVRVRTQSGGSPNLISLSNWFRFDVPEIITHIVKAPNVFTPNDDEFNNAFVFENLSDYPNSKLLVFNRWGTKVYESNNYQNDWKGDNLSDGVYYYSLKIADKKSTEMAGTVNIIRNK